MANSHAVFFILMGIFWINEVSLSNITWENDCWHSSNCVSQLLSVKWMKWSSRRTAFQMEYWPKWNKQQFINASRSCCPLAFVWGFHSVQTACWFMPGSDDQATENNRPRLSEQLLFGFICSPVPAFVCDTTLGPLSGLHTSQGQMEIPGVL